MKTMSYIFKKKNSTYFIDFYRNDDGCEYAIIKVCYNIRDILYVSHKYAMSEVERLMKEGYVPSSIKITL